VVLLWGLGSVSSLRVHTGVMFLAVRVFATALVASVASAALTDPVESAVLFHRHGDR
jgi:hypothetical protein